MMQAQAMTMMTSKRRICGVDSGLKAVLLSLICQLQAIPRSPAYIKNNKILVSLAVNNFVNKFGKKVETAKKS